MTVIIEGTTAANVVVQVDPLVELGALVHAVLYGSHHPRTNAPRERILESDSSHLMTRVQRFRPLFGVIRARYLFPTSLTSDSTPDFLDRLNDVAQMPLDRFAQFTAISLVEDSRTFRDIDPMEDCGAFLRELVRLNVSHLELGHALMEDPEKVRRELIALLVDIEEQWFRREWEECRNVLFYEANLRRRELTCALAPGIAEISATATVEQTPERVVFDKINRGRFTIHPQGLILAPSYHVSPHLILKHDGVYPHMITYAVGDTGNSVSLAEVKQRLQALLDDARMEICRCIARTPSTTVDLAIELQMTQPQVSRHLRVLRTAGLVNREQRGRFVYYSLKAGVLRNLGPQIIATMLR